MTKKLIQFALAMLALLSVAATASAWPQLSRVMDIFSSKHIIGYDFSNASGSSIHLESVHILETKLHLLPIGGPGAYRNCPNSIRKECSVKSLMKTTADLVWWDKKFADPDSPKPKLIDASKKQTTSVPFPEFDKRAKIWKCHYVFQTDHTWSGQFENVTVKPIGEKAGTHNVSPTFPDQQWIHFQFKNASGKPFYMQQHDGKLQTGDHKTWLFIPAIAADNQFYGFAAHAHQGSCFRPQAGSKLVFSWAFPGNPPDVFEEFELPEFSEDQKNWYCYFVFGKDQKWTATFEGVKSP